MKFGFDLARWFRRKRCLKSVDDGRTTDEGRTDNGTWLYYKIIYEPKGSRELNK